MTKHTAQREAVRPCCVLKWVLLGPEGLSPRCTDGASLSCFAASSWGPKLLSVPPRTEKGPCGQALAGAQV